MIVVIGNPSATPASSGPAARGLPAAIALAAVRSGAIVEVVGRVADDPAGDAVLHALAAAGVGHVATLRVADVAPVALEPADVDLALRYLASPAVIVLAEPGSAEQLAATAADAAGWSGAALVIVVAAGSSSPEGLPPGAAVFEAPTDDPDDAFAGWIARYVVALDRGDPPDAAFAAVIGDADVNGSMSSGPSRRTSLTRRGTA